MTEVKKEGVILEVTDLEFENQAVLNPTIVQGNNLHMFYRAVRNGNHSSIGYCRLDGPLKVVERSKTPVLVPEFDYEKQGAEDPRIVLLDGIYYLTYTAYDGKNALIAYAVSKDLKIWEKKGVISPRIIYKDVKDVFLNSKLKEKHAFFKSYFAAEGGDDIFLWEKDAFLFPKKFNGKFAMIHRILPAIQVIYFKKFSDLTLEYWINYLKKLPEHVVLKPTFWYESRNIGGGAPPIETDKGWLMIFHAVENSSKGKVYHTSAALLDKDNPCKVIGHLKNPLFSPTEDYEKIGDVNNVVFATGTSIFQGRLYIYYGAADKKIAVASVDLNELLEELSFK